MVAVELGEAGAEADELLATGSEAEVKRTLRPS